MEGAATQNLLNELLATRKRLQQKQSEILARASDLYQAGQVDYVPMNVGDTIYIDPAKGWKCTLIEHNDSKDIFDVYVKAGHELDDHQHYQIERIRIFQGVLHWRTGSTKMLLHPGDIVTMRPNEPHGGIGETDVHMTVMFAPPLTTPKSE